MSEKPDATSPTGKFFTHQLALQIAREQMAKYKDHATEKKEILEFLRDAQDAIDYYHEREGCPELKAEHARLLRDLAPVDVHTQTAALMHGVTPEEVTPEMRQAGKTANFTAAYTPEMVVRGSRQIGKTDSFIAAYAPENTPEPLHVYTWLEQPPVDEGERQAKEWLDKFTNPAFQKSRNGDNEWLAARLLTVEWQGQRYICSGASSMGDVWLKSEGSKSFYDHRVDVEQLSNWKMEEMPK